MMSLGKRARTVDDIVDVGCCGPVLKRGNTATEESSEVKANVYDIRILMLNARLLAKRKNAGSDKNQSVETNC